MIALTDLDRALELARDDHSEFIVQHKATEEVSVQSPKGPPATGTRIASLALRTADYKSSIYNARGDVLLLRGEYDRALADLDQALALNATSGQARFDRGMALFGLGRCKEGMEDIRAAGALVGRSAEILLSDESNRAFIAKTACGTVST